MSVKVTAGFMSCGIENRQGHDLKLYEREIVIDGICYDRYVQYSHEINEKRFKANVAPADSNEILAIIIEYGLSYLSGDLLGDRDED